MHGWRGVLLRYGSQGVCPLSWRLLLPVIDIGEHDVCKLVHEGLFLSTWNWRGGENSRQLPSNVLLSAWVGRIRWLDTSGFVGLLHLEAAGHYKMSARDGTGRIRHEDYNALVRHQSRVQAADRKHRHKACLRWRVPGLAGKGGCREGRARKIKKRR